MRPSFSDYFLCAGENSAIETTFPASSTLLPKKPACASGEYGWFRLRDGAAGTIRTIVHMCQRGLASGGAGQAKHPKPPCGLAAHAARSLSAFFSTVAAVSSNPVS